MALACQNCGGQFPDDPMLAVEEDRLDGYVAHIESGDEEFMVSKTSYYCDVECFIAGNTP